MGSGTRGNHTRAANRTRDVVRIIMRRMIERKGFWPFSFAVSTRRRDIPVPLNSSLDSHPRHDIIIFHQRWAKGEITSRVPFAAARQQRNECGRAEEKNGMVPIFKPEKVLHYGTVYNLLNFIEWDSRKKKEPVYAPNLEESLTRKFVLTPPLLSQFILLSVGVCYNIFYKLSSKTTSHRYLIRNGT